MNIVYSEEDAMLVREQLGHTALSFDFETTSLDWMTAEIIGLGIADSTSEWYFVVKGGMGEAGLARVLSGWFDDPAQVLIAHNVDFDVQFLHNLGIRPHQSPHDTMGLAQLYNESTPLGLKDLAGLVLDREMRAWDKTLPDWPIEEIAKYCCEDARSTYDLCVWFSQNMPKQLWPYYHSFIRPLPIVAAAMERAGWSLDQQGMMSFGDDLEEEIDAAKLRICASTPGLENPNSTKQLIVALEGLGASWKRDEYTAKRNKSVNRSTLERFMEEGTPAIQELAKSVLAYRAQIKLQGYITGKRGLLANASKDGRIHPSWRTFGTVTGRWACSKPNLQNIPKKRKGDDSLVNARDWFVAAPGNVLVAADLAQAELRVMAALAQDKKFMRTFAEEQDGHLATAVAIFDKPPQDISPFERFIGKTINFAIPYGAGARRVMSVAGITIARAEELLARFFRQHREIERWIERTKEQARLDGVVYTAYGRPRRPLLLQFKKFLYAPPIEEQEPGDDRLLQAGFDRELAKKGTTRQKLRQLSGRQFERQIRYFTARGGRQAVNAVIQGTVADIINKGLIALVTSGISVIGQIHDEVIVECSEDDAQDVARVLTRALTTTLNGVNLTLTAKILRKWGEDA